MYSFKILTLFPEIFSSFFSESLLKKAIEQKFIQIDFINYRQYGTGKHLNVDDTPYGGGPGMVLKPAPIIQALQEGEQNSSQKWHKILLTPQGKPLHQKKIKELNQLNCPLALICGRYEGFDERVRYFVDDEVSLGDFILLGGEVAAIAIIEAITRLIPGVIGNQLSLEQESFNDNLLEYAQYTKPLNFNGYSVPDVLLSGHHQAIHQWRQQNALERTKKRRPDLL